MKAGGWHMREQHYVVADPKDLGMELSCCERAVVT
jgi:hypothetical protein